MACGIKFKSWLPFSGVLCRTCNAWDGVEYLRKNRDEYYYFDGNLHYKGIKNKGKTQRE